MGSCAKAASIPGCTIFSRSSRLPVLSVDDVRGYKAGEQQKCPGIKESTVWSASPYGKRTCRTEALAGPLTRLDVRVFGLELGALSFPSPESVHEARQWLAPVGAYRVSAPGVVDAAVVEAAPALGVGRMRAFFG